MTNEQRFRHLEELYHVLSARYDADHQEISTLKQEISILKQQSNGHHQNLSSLNTRSQTLEQELATVRHRSNAVYASVRGLRRKFEIATVVIGIVLGFAAISGISLYLAWEAVRDHIQQSANTTISEVTSRITHLVTGLALNHIQSYNASIKELLPLYQIDHYNEIVDYTLLNSYEQSNRRIEGLAMIDDLKKDHGRFMNFSEPLLYNDIASIEIEAAALDNNPRGLEDSLVMLKAAIERESR